MEGYSPNANVMSISIKKLQSNIDLAFHRTQFSLVYTFTNEDFPAPFCLWEILDIFYDKRKNMIENERLQPFQLLIDISVDWSVISVLMN